MEVKDCYRRGGGRYVIFADHHEQLLAAGGWYFFVLKKKPRNGKGPDRVQFCKWVPACAIDLVQYGTRIRKSHLDEYETREVCDIAFGKIWTEIRKLDRKEMIKRDKQLGYRYL